MRDHLVDLAGGIGLAMNDGEASAYSILVSNYTAAVSQIAFLTHERDGLKAKCQRYRAALKEMSLYVAANGDDWVQRQARESLGETE